MLITGVTCPVCVTPVELIDHDGAFASIVKGRYRDSIRGSSATIRLAEASISEADWFTEFDGILTAWDPKDRVYTLSLRFDDRPLEMYHTCKLSQSDWPAADSKVWGQQAPRPYGKHSSLGATKGGMLPTFPVDVARYRYLVCRGCAKSVDRVYVSGTQVTTGWTASYVTVNGSIYTVVTFTTDQKDAVVTVDIQGYETVGDGSGTLIEGPVDQLAHALKNWVWGEYRTGAWLTAAPINAAAVTACAAYFTRKGLKGSGYIKDRFRGHDLLSGWLKSWRARGWWTNGGELAIGIEDHAIATPYPSPLYREDRHDIGGSFKQATPETLLSSVAVKHMYSGSLGSYVQQLTVGDPDSTLEAEEPLEMLWSYASPT